MNEKVLIVEDQFVEANDIQIILVKAGYTVCGIARSVNIALKMIEHDKPGLVLLDIFLKGKLTGIDLAKKLKDQNIAFIYISANSNHDVLSEAKTTGPYGFIVKPFREKDLLVTLEIARYRHQNSLEASSRKDSLLRKQLTTIVHESISMEEKLLRTAISIQSFVPFEYLSVGFNPSGEHTFDDIGFLRAGFDEYQMIKPAELMNITNMKLHDIGLLQKNQLNYSKLISDTFHMKSHLYLPLAIQDGVTFHYCFYSRKAGAYTSDHFNEISRLQDLLTDTVNSIIISVRKLSAPPIKQVQANPENDTVKHGKFKGIIGSSHLLLSIFDQLSSVAPLTTSVLILGESGTGKERIACTIHELSPRKLKPFVKLNCAALPATLIESELFGHEKGAFTGAVEKRTGKFEQASGGTIFLDEIGEMPVDLQVKLLRVLQEKEIERLGGRAPINIDVRIIAATNKNLEKEVAEGRFRLDLYYRLNVFPIVMPALRDRTEDIPALVSHFLQLCCIKTGKTVTRFSDLAINKLQAYHWPGNIRELEHLVERSVLLAKESEIKDVALPRPQKQDEALLKKETLPLTFDENERYFILNILKKCNGKIWGSGGAAEILNVPPTTLSSKMKKLGIRREFRDYL